jgi:hypothetical protein
MGLVKRCQPGLVLPRLFGGGYGAQGCQRGAESESDPESETEADPESELAKAPFDPIRS